MYKMNFKYSKTIQGLFIFSILWVLGGCELIKKGTQQPSIEKVTQEPIVKLLPEEKELCVSAAQEEDFDAFCDASYWLQFILEAQFLTWPERIQMITDLDDETSSLLKKILLSQGVDTPYQHRLRAQTWIEQIEAEASNMMQLLLNKLIFENSKQLLEFESAMTILSRVNSRQEKTISELELIVSERDQEIRKQQDQVEQLLKIETDLIEQNRNEKQ